MINIDFRFIICDFWAIQDKRTRLVVLWVPLLIVASCLVVSIIDGTDYFALNLSKSRTILIPLLALMLTGITFLTNWKDNVELKKYDTERKLRNHKVTLYEYMVINFFYVIIFDILLLLSSVIAGLFPNIASFLWALVANSVFTFFVIHLLLAMLINIGDLFFVLTKQ